MKTFDEVLNPAWNKGEPKPFPGGKWPTRIAWLIEFADREKKFYKGKPSRNAVARFFQHCKLKDVVRSTFGEFDKGGCIALVTLNGPYEFQPTIRLVPDHTERAYNIYHYFYYDKDYGFWPLGVDFLKKNWLTKLEGYWTYSPTAELTRTEHNQFKRHIQAMYKTKVPTEEKPLEPGKVGWNFQYRAMY